MQNKWGDTSLHEARESQNFVIIKTLLAHGVDKNIKNVYGQISEID